MASYTYNGYYFYILFLRQRIAKELTSDFQSNFRASLFLVIITVFCRPQLILHLCNNFRANEIIQRSGRLLQAPNIHLIQIYIIF